LECRHRQHAHVEDRIRDDKDTGLSKFPFKAFALNEVWLEIVALAHDLIVWTQALILDGELAKAEPKRLRYRLLHVAGRLAFSGRRAKLHLQNTWPWVTQLKVRRARFTGHLGERSESCHGRLTDQVLACLDGCAEGVSFDQPLGVEAASELAHRGAELLEGVEALDP